LVSANDIDVFGQGGAGMQLSLARNCVICVGVLYESSLIPRNCVTWVGRLSESSLMARTLIFCLCTIRQYV
jgi:hypothetical protein